MDISSLSSPVSSVLAGGSAYSASSATTSRPEAARSSTATPAPAAPASQGEVEQAVKVVSDFVQQTNSSLEFSIDKESERLVVKVRDVETKEVIRQIPSEAILKMAQALGQVQGLLLQQKA